MVMAMARGSVSMDQAWISGPPCESPRRRMERTYDIFEILADGSPIWKQSVSGHEPALARMRELAAESPNEFRMMHLATNSVAAILPADEPRSASGAEEEEPRERSDKKNGELSLCKGRTVSVRRLSRTRPLAPRDGAGVERGRQG